MTNKVQAEEKRAQLRKAALEYHQFPTPGKVAIAATKQLVNQHDLALAYSPGVAAPCEEIVKDPANAFKYTSRGNLVGVVTNGTAVLGLGDIGPLAGKLLALGDHLEEHNLERCPAVVFADRSKAFERIGIAWLFRVLRRWQLPRWAVYA